MAAGYSEKEVERVSKKGRGGLKQLNPLRLLGPIVDRVQRNIRRPHTYGSDEGKAWKWKPGAVIKDEAAYEGGWSVDMADPLVRASFNPFFKGDKKDPWIMDDSGQFKLNPQHSSAGTMQTKLDEGFTRASSEGMYGWGWKGAGGKHDERAKDYVGGKKYVHPDFPEKGESFYKAKVDVLGDVYYDEEGNYADYYNYGLDKGESILNPTNLLRGVTSAFTSPRIVSGRASKIEDYQSPKHFREKLKKDYKAGGVGEAEFTKTKPVTKPEQAEKSSRLSKFVDFFRAGSKDEKALLQPSKPGEKEKEDVLQKPYKDKLPKGGGAESIVERGKAQKLISDTKPAPKRSKLGKMGSAERAAEYKRRNWAMDATISVDDGGTWKPKGSK